MEKAQVILAFAFGLTFVVTLLVLAVQFPTPTHFQLVVFRTVLALAAAGVAAMVPGFLDVKVTASTRLVIEAGGAIAVFVVVYFFNPAKLAVQEAAREAQGGLDVVGPALRPVWEILDPTLQDAFVLAANAAVREGKTIVSTRTLFGALRLLAPDRLSEFFERLPAGSLPEAISTDIPRSRSALRKIDKLSSCVENSLANLSPFASEVSRVSEVDLFVGLARFGQGESVRQLRTHGVDAGRINAIVEQLGWRVKRREERPA